MDLHEDDIRDLFEATAVLARDPVPTFEVVLELIRSLISCTSVSFNDMTLATGDFRYSIVPDDQAAIAVRLKPAYDRFAHPHQLTQHAWIEAGGLVHPGGEGLALDDAVDDAGRVLGQQGVATGVGPKSEAGHDIQA